MNPRIKKVDSIPESQGRGVVIAYELSDLKDLPAKDLVNLIKNIKGVSKVSEIKGPDGREQIFVNSKGQKFVSYTVLFDPGFTEKNFFESLELELKIKSVELALARTEAELKAAAAGRSPSSSPTRPPEGVDISEAMKRREAEEKRAKAAAAARAGRPPSPLSGPLAGADMAEAIKRRDIEEKRAKAAAAARVGRPPSPPPPVRTPVAGAVRSSSPPPARSPVVDISDPMKLREAEEKREKAAAARRLEIERGKAPRKAAVAVEPPKRSAAVAAVAKFGGTDKTEAQIKDMISRRTGIPTKDINLQLGIHDTVVVTCPDKHMDKLISLHRELDKGPSGESAHVWCYPSLFEKNKHHLSIPVTLFKEIVNNNFNPVSEVSAARPTGLRR